MKIESSDGNLTLEYSNEFPLRFRLRQKIKHDYLPSVPITARNFEPKNGSTIYSQRMRQVVNPPNPFLQYIEVGAGLGEFTPHLSQFDLICRPIVIDPAQYALIRSILNEVRPSVMKEDIDWLETLIQRCDILLDSSKVELFNESLGQTIENNPNLLGIADIVVDNHGAVEWRDTRGQSYERIREMEFSLLKKGGLLLTSEEELIKQ